MSATLFLDDPIEGDEYRIDCEEVRIMGELAWATPEGGDKETIVPLSNVNGVTGDVVEQEVEAVESLGGHFTELLTEVA